MTRILLIYLSNILIPIYLTDLEKKTKDKLHVTWCVLKIEPKYIYYLSTMFSVTNAANSYNKRNIGVTGDFKKFQMLFAPEIHIVTSYAKKTISRGRLKPKYPTDEQAEVLVRDEIPVIDIIHVCFKDEKDLASGRAALNSYDTSNFIVDSSLFTNMRK